MNKAFKQQGAFSWSELLVYDVESAEETECDD